MSHGRLHGVWPLRNSRPNCPARLADAAALDVLQFHHRIPLGVGQAGFGIQGAFGVGQRDHLAAQVHDFARRILGHVARAGNRHTAAIDTLVLALEHFFSEVHAAIAGGFRADQAAAVGHALAGQHRGELVGQALVLAKHEADFAGTHANVTSRYVAISTDVAVQLAHERLAEAHHFGVTLAFRVEVRPTFAAPMGSEVNEFLNTCSKARNFSTLRFTDGWKRRPPLYGPMALLIWMR